MKRCITAAILTLAPSLPAIAQPGVPGWDIEVIGGPVSPSNPTVTVRVSARFSWNDHAFGAGLFSITAEDGEWTGARILLPPPGNPGALQGRTVSGINVGQIHFPHFVIADPSNPIAVWEGDWAATHFRPRTVQLSTLTTRFDVYISSQSPQSESRLAQLTEGFGEIHVIPAPASALALLGVAAMASRRGRGEKLARSV